MSHRMQADVSRMLTCLDDIWSETSACGRYRENTTVPNIVSTLFDGNIYTPETILVLNNWEFSNLANRILLPTPNHYNANTHQTVTGIVKKPASNQPAKTLRP